VAILPHTLKNPGFSPPRDFTAVALVTDKGFIALATHASTQITQVKDVAEWARKHPGQVNMGVPAPGSIPEFAVGLLAKSLHVETTPVPYRAARRCWPTWSGARSPSASPPRWSSPPTPRARRCACWRFPAPAAWPNFPTFPPSVKRASRAWSRAIWSASTRRPAPPRA
jgi:hypothetical protein